MNDEDEELQSQEIDWEEFYKNRMRIGRMQVVDEIPKDGEPLIVREI